MVFSCRTKQGDSAYVNFLNRVCERTTWFGDGRCERIEVADYDRDVRNVLRLQIICV